MPKKCIVVETDGYDDLYSQEFDDEDDAKKYIEETGQKCYLITVSAPLECWDGVKVSVEPHT